MTDIPRIGRLEIPSILAEPFHVAGQVLTEAFGISATEVLTLGGGTVLAMYYRHRVSTDLDFFAKLYSSTSSIPDCEKIN